MLKVRLQRVGKKHEPVFRVVVTESQAGPKAGKAVEVVGSYDPRFNKIELKKERISYWMGVGAQVSPTVHNMLVKENVVSGKKINVLPKKSPIKKEGEEVVAEVKKEEAPAPAPVSEETPVAETEVKTEEKEAETAPTPSEDESESRPESVGKETPEETPLESTDTPEAPEEEKTTA